MTNNERICERIKQGHYITALIAHIIASAENVEISQDNILAYYSQGEQLRDALNADILKGLLEEFKKYESLK